MTLLTPCNAACVESDVWGGDSSSHPSDLAWSCSPFLQSFVTKEQLPTPLVFFSEQSSAHLYRETRLLIRREKKDNKPFRFGLFLPILIRALTAIPSNQQRNSKQKDEFILSSVYLRSRELCTSLFFSYRRQDDALLHSCTCPFIESTLPKAFRGFRISGQAWLTVGDYCVCR